MSLQPGIAIGLHRLNAAADDQPDDIEPAILACLAPDHESLPPYPSEDAPLWHDPNEEVTS